MQETQVWSLIWEDPTCRRAAKLVRCIWACAREPGSHITEPHVPSSRCPTARETTVVRNLLAATGQRLLQQHRPSTAGNKYINKRTHKTSPWPSWLNLCLFPPHPKPCIPGPRFWPGHSPPAQQCRSHLPQKGERVWPGVILTPGRSQSIHRPLPFWRWVNQKQSLHSVCLSAGLPRRLLSTPSWRWRLCEVYGLLSPDQPPVARHHPAGAPPDLRSCERDESQWRAGGHGSVRPCLQHPLSPAEGHDTQFQNFTTGISLDHSFHGKRSLLFHVFFYQLMTAMKMKTLLFLNIE